MKEKKSIEDLKQEQINYVLETFEEDKEMYPHITIIATKTDEDDETPSVIHMPLTGGVMNSKETKTKFVEFVIPEINEELKKRNFKVECIVFVAESWKTTISTENNEEPKQEEAVIIIIEDKNSNCTKFYNIVREDMKVTDTGFESSCKLVFDSEIENDPREDRGLFSNLYSKFAD
jgi:hypothetical protein